MSRILIIEDEPEIAELERDYLEINGFEVDVAENGAKGLDMAFAAAYDLYILDLMLPKVNGFEILKYIRESKSVPIIVVSAKKDDLDKIKGLGFGADDYITKPFSPNELVARVKAHISRYERIISSVADEKVTDSSKDVISFRGIKLDKAQRLVWLNDKEVYFTTQEFKVLEYFLEHPGEVVSKEQIFEAVWDNEYVSDASTVSVHIKNIRDKIELTGTPQYIETVWGSGYRLRV